MRIGVIYPHTEYPADPVAIRDYAQAAEGLGYAHVGADDHVIGPHPDRPGGWTAWVTNATPFVEPFVLFSFMAAVTSRIELATCVLLLPQRQTVLVAKQAAGVDQLSGGRLRLGLGVGWNQVEYQSLGADFRTRGRRLDEQIGVLRALWTRDHVAFDDPWHSIPDAGICPLPVQRPIPLWFGGDSEVAVRRAARVGDGWMPLFGSASAAASALTVLDQALADAGRDRSTFGLEARIPYGRGDADEWHALLDGWRGVGATHASLLVTDSGLSTPAEHLAALERFSRAVVRDGA
ncbi:MAG TPA: LLM class F420-dependent oxidoreductase [Cellulomonas sp.]